MNVSNWDTWQTFRKDRGTPPWIKLYRNLLSNAEWVSLSDAEKGQLISIWILAADKKGVIPDDPKTIQKMVGLDEVPNINKFIDLQFLTASCQPSGNHIGKGTAICDAPETETETETETEVTLVTKPNGLLTKNIDVLNLWNKFAATNNLPQKRSPTDGLKQSINNITKKQKWKLDDWETFLTLLSNSDFLMGKSGNWKMNMDWLAKPTNFSKAISGNYHE